MQVFIYCKFTLHVSGVQRAHHQEYNKTVNAASVTGHSNGATTFLQCGLIRPRWRNVVALILSPVPEAAVKI